MQTPICTYLFKYITNHVLKPVPMQPNLICTAFLKLLNAANNNNQFSNLHAHSSETFTFSAVAVQIIMFRVFTTLVSHSNIKSESSQTTSPNSRIAAISCLRHFRKTTSTFPSSTYRCIMLMTHFSGFGADVSLTCVLVIVWVRLCGNCNAEQLA